MQRNHNEDLDPATCYIIQPPSMHLKKELTSRRRVNPLYLSLPVRRTHAKCFELVATTKRKHAAIKRISDHTHTAVNLPNKRETRKENQVAACERDGETCSVICRTSIKGINNAFSVSLRLDAAALSTPREKRRQDVPFCFLSLLLVVGHS